MGEMRRVFLLCSTIVCLPALLVYGQDGQSLADLARQARQQKPQKDDPSEAGRASKTAKVISDEEIREHAGESEGPSTPGDKSRPPSGSTSTSKDAKTSAEQWKSKILAQKQLIRSMQNDIDKLDSSIHFSAKSVRWNEGQKQKQQEVERMRAQLEDQKKRLEEMQESARRQGYGNSVYDP
jgi:predicted ribosome quality control (RQC) complex YloA/Tae2 family protein